MNEKDRNRSRDEAIEKIEYHIIKNKLEPDEKIPSERDMCTMWGFNRTTLRASIQRLVVEGKLYQKKGSGTYIAKPKFIRELQDIKSLSEQVKEKKQVLTNKLISMDIIESNDQATQKSKLHLIKKLNIPLGNKIYALTRLRLIDGEPVTIETSFISYNSFPELSLHDFSKESLYSVLENHYNIKIIKGQETISIAYATEDEAQLLSIDVGQAVFHLTGIVYDEKNNPIEYFKSIIRADKMRFSSILR